MVQQFNTIHITIFYSPTVGKVSKLSHRVWHNLPGSQVNQRDNISQSNKICKWISRPCQRTKETVEHEENSDTSCKWRAWNDSNILERRLESWELEDELRSSTLYSIGQNTEKSPEDLRRLIVTHTPVTNHQLVWITCQNNNNNNNNNNDKSSE